jgi:serpin B
MIHKVSRVDSNVTLQFANCIDVNSAMGISLLPQYKADMQQYYDAQIYALDFTKSSSLDIINNWCNKHTGGMIPTAVDRLEPDAVLYLLNAIYFKANWTEKFDPEDTRNMNFTTQNGTVVKHNMMHRQTRTLYGKNKICQMLYLSYGNKDFGMYVLLPVKGKTTADIIQGLSARELEQQLNGMKDENVDILMPRFYTSSETTLNHVLSAMGMPLVFTSRAELPNMAQGEKDLYARSHRRGQQPLLGNLTHRERECRKARKNHLLYADERHRRKTESGIRASHRGFASGTRQYQG